MSKADKAPPLAIPASMLIPDDEKLPSSMKTPESAILIYGENGCGKTNILEAISPLVGLSPTILMNMLLTIDV